MLGILRLAEGDEAEVEVVDGDLGAVTSVPNTGAAGAGAILPSFIGGSFSLSLSAFLACSNVEIAKFEKVRYENPIYTFFSLIIMIITVPFLIPSAPVARVPAGRISVPRRFLSSEIFSLSSLIK